MNIEWNAELYSDKFSFVHEYGKDLFSYLGVVDKKSILDLGCGNGALTKALSDLGADVVGMDASEEMLEQARATYPDLEFEWGDATDFTVNHPMDAVFSNAVFHWIDNQDALIGCIHRALKPSGLLVCEFGGIENNEKIHCQLESGFEKRGLTYPRTFFFPSIGDYTSKLESHGFRVTDARLFDRLTPQEGEDGLKNWIELFVKKPFEGLTEEFRREVIEEAVEALREELYINGVWMADYVRLRIRAVRK